MVERGEVVNGSTGEVETVETVRNGKLRWYKLTEHQFEILGDVRDLNRKMEVFMFFLGMFISVLLAIITVENHGSIKAIILYCLGCISLVLSIAYCYESIKDKGKAETIYKTLKEEGAQ